MSIRQVQIANVFDIVAQSYLMDGHTPLLDDIYKFLNRFFANQPAGSPYNIPMDTFQGKKLSDPDVLNDFMAVLIANIDTLYEVCFNHIDQILVLNTILRNHLERLRIKRNMLSTKIDDYLLGIYNSDGYFYSFSDDFASVGTVDFDYTDAFIDTTAGVVTIPAISTKSRLIDPDSMSLSYTTATTQSGQQLTLIPKSQFDDAVDGLTNTAWQFEIKTNLAGPIIVDFGITFSEATSESILSKIDVTPFGVEPIQCGINAVHRTPQGLSTLMPFSNKIKTGGDKMIFIADQPQKSINSLSFQIKKNKPDYYINDAWERTAVYIFGFKELAFSEQFFDPDARFMSNPISIPTELGKDAVIDAVSLVVDDNTPMGTNIRYFVAADNPDADNISHYQWQQIEPLTDSKQLNAQIVRFSGTQTKERYLRLTPRNPGDVQIFPLNSTHVDPTKRNPTPSYFASLYAYRVAAMADDYLMPTVQLEEGLNSTRIYYTALATEAYSQGFDFWRNKFDSGSYSIATGEIDTGKGFFYGADVGENGKSCYAETFVYVDEETPVMLKDCRKSDLNSRTWDIKVYLNGREIAALPVGVHKLTVPWKFKQGKNHVVVMSNIPSISADSAAPYIGSFDIMADAELYDYGVVKLEDWTYVDPYKFEHNLTNEANSFTIFNGEIVTRKQPTNNFRLSYNQAQATAPKSIRVRADLTRSQSFSNVSPVIDQYRVRFAYGDRANSG